MCTRSDRGVTNRVFALMSALGIVLAPILSHAQSSHGPAPRGNPSELVAAESALAHLAHDKGANAALLAYADDTAEFVAPQRSLAKAWLKAHNAAPWFAGRQTGNVWASCDGTAGVSAGLWDGGWFATVWKQQKKFNYKWALTDAGPLATLPPAPDWVTGKLADCPPRMPRAAGAVPSGPPTVRPLPAPIPPLDVAGADSRDGRSDDGSLVWRSTIMADGSRRLRVWVYRDGAMQAVIARDVPAGG